MDQVLFIAQILLAMFLILVIVIQQKGTGLGGTFGGEMAFYRTKRGAEKLLFNLTIFLSSAFILLSIASLII